MTFNTWAKRLITSNVEGNGQWVYNKEGWFCAMNSGFLLNVKLDKVSFGYFRVQYNIMPLVAPLNENYEGIHMSMGCERDAGSDYHSMVNDYFSDMSDMEYLDLRTRDYKLPEVSEICVKIIRNYLNPIFCELDSLQSYCIQRIRMMLAFIDKSKSSQERENDARELFLHGFKDGIEKPMYYQNDRYDPDYPWYAIYTNGLPFVYAAFGKYKEALAHLGFENKILGELDRTSEALKQAMLNNDAEACNEILNQVYQKNRIAIENALGLKLPENQNFGDSVIS